MAVDRAFVELFATRWHAAWSAHDVDAVLALLAGDVEWVESGVRRVLRGHGDARRRLEADFRTVPDLRAETVALIVDAEQDAAAVQWRLTGTVEGGRPLAFDGVSLWRFAGERLARLEMVYDVGDVTAQMGPPGTTAGRPRHGVQRLTARAREALKR